MGGVGGVGLLMGRGEDVGQGPGFVSLFCDFVFFGHTAIGRRRESVSLFWLICIFGHKIPAFEANLCPFSEIMHFSDTKATLFAVLFVSFFPYFLIFGYKLPAADAKLYPFSVGS